MSDDMLPDILTEIIQFLSMKLVWPLGVGKNQFFDLEEENDGGG